jgi:hypothetical protein
LARPHALAEAFSALTGNPVTRVDANDASEFIATLAHSPDFVEISAPEILLALKQARRKGVRGGRVHDFPHAVAAEKSGAEKILTLDRNDCSGITHLPVEQA